MTVQQQLRQWLLALRDLCDQGATGASVTIGGGAIITYSPAGAFVIAGGRTLRIGDEWLEHHGFAVAESPSRTSDSLKEVER